MSSTERKTCSKCGRTKIVDEFFSYRDGTKCDMCKQCLLEHVDNSDPDTFLWLLEKFDVPYIERVWVETANKVYSEAPANFGPMSVFGKYLRNMKMAQYKAFRYCDSPALNDQYGHVELTEEMEAALRSRLDSGEISASQYDTLSGRSALTKSDVATSPAKKRYTAKYDMDRDIDASLTDEDRRYLINKWGLSYTASEWLKMEDLYTRYVSEYDMSVDREETLKKICKTSLKMDQALDSDNMLDYKNLSQVLDSLRKSGKFTETQNREDRTDLVDSIGQLVQLCEREGGIIEQFPDPQDYPQDKIDLTINDYKQYAVNLLRNEPNIAGLIESYVAKLTDAESKTQGLMDRVGGDLPPLPGEEEEDDVMTEEEEMEFLAKMGLV